MTKLAIQVSRVDKGFRLPHEKQTTLKGMLINFRKRGFEKQQVLRDVSFNVKKGEFLGIVGRNGSGKSTLLKMISGIYYADTGSITIDGKLTPFIELGVGFNPELSGRDNVYLNGALLGFSRTEVDAIYEEIVEFAELSRFMDQKLKNYSSGMQVRLAFSIAIKVQTDILVLDEVLAVGDAAFQQKCFDYFMQLKQLKKTVVLVTHDMNAVRQYCDRAILIEKGSIIKEGTPETVSAAYHQLFLRDFEGQASNNDTLGERWGTGEIQTTKTSINVSGDDVTVTTVYQSNATIKNPIFGLSIYSPSDTGLIDANTYQAKKQTGVVQKDDVVTVVWKIPNIFVNGKYRVSVGCASASFHVTYDQVPYAASFRVSRDTPTSGIIYPDITLASFSVDSQTKR